MSKLLEFFKGKKLIPTITALVIAVVLIAAGFYSTTYGKAEQAQSVEVVSLNLTETVEASGSLEAKPYAELRWKTSGVVASVDVKPGQKVKKDSALLTLQPESTSANIASAQADLVSARENLEDTINSDSGLAQALIDLEDAEQEYEDKAGYLKYLQTNENVPLIETYGWFKKSKTGGWTADRYTRNYRGPATESMLVEAENNAELARATLEDLQRKIELLKNNEQDVLAAQARVDAAQATVNSMSIIAPFDGEVLSVKQRVGDVINSGDVSVKIADTNHLYVEVDIDESDIAKVKAGNSAEITLDALPDAAFTGKVTAVNPVGEVVSGLVKYTVRVELDALKDKTFLPLGSTANVVITVKDSAATLAVPIAAIQNDEQGEYVWVTQDDGATKRVDVVSGSIAGDLVVVNGALQAGDVLELTERKSSFKAPGPFGGGSK